MVEQGSSGTDATQNQPGGHLVGTVVDGRYQIEALLGEGGMGLVYKATHTALGKQLAVKVLRPEVSRNDEIVARFRQEAQSASAIGNQHIIDISDFGQLPDGSTYFVMEFLGGHSLTDALEGQGRFDTMRTITIALQLCNALGAAHEVGIVHRDMKPDNVQLIERGGSKDFVKVLDFGIAKVGGGTSKLTQAGQVFGTPHYMSPEQCAGSGVDHRTDIYALGVMLFEMLVGRVPFDADTLMGILTKHMYEAPPEPRQLEPTADISDGMQRVILRCLAKNADERYQSMAELAADLRAVAEGVAPETGRFSLPGTVESPVTGNFSVPDSRTSEAAYGETRMSIEGVPGVPRSSRKGLFVGLAVLLIGGGALAAVMMGGEPGDAAPQAAGEATSEAIAPDPETGEQPDPAAEPTPDDAEATAAADDEQPAEEQPPARVEVEVGSKPTGAEVYREDQLVGTTPYRMVRPEGDEKVELELRLSGYKDRNVTVSSITGEQLVLKLSKRRAVKRRPKKKSPRPKKREPAPSKPRKKIQNEVLDPWG